MRKRRGEGMEKRHKDQLGREGEGASENTIQCISRGRCSLMYNGDLQGLSKAAILVNFRGHPLFYIGQFVHR